MDGWPWRPGDVGSFRAGAIGVYELAALCGVGTDSEPQDEQQALLTTEPFPS